MSNSTGPAGGTRQFVRRLSDANLTTPSAAGMNAYEEDLRPNLAVQIHDNAQWDVSRPLSPSLSIYQEPSAAKSMASLQNEIELTFNDAQQADEAATASVSGGQQEGLMKKIVQMQNELSSLILQMHKMHNGASNAPSMQPAQAQCMVPEPNDDAVGEEGIKLNIDDIYGARVCQSALIGNSADTQEPTAAAKGINHEVQCSAAAYATLQNAQRQSMQHNGVTHGMGNDGRDNGHALMQNAATYQMQNDATVLRAVQLPDAVAMYGYDARVQNGAPNAAVHVTDASDMHDHAAAAQRGMAKNAMPFATPMRPQYMPNAPNAAPMQHRQYNGPSTTAQNADVMHAVHNALNGIRM